MEGFLKIGREGAPQARTRIRFLRFQSVQSSMMPLFEDFNCNVWVDRQGGCWQGFLLGQCRTEKGRGKSNKRGKGQKFTPAQVSLPSLTTGSSKFLSPSAPGAEYRHVF